MKKLLAMILTLAMLLSLTACGGGETRDPGLIGGLATTAAGNRNLTGAEELEYIAVYGAAPDSMDAASSVGAGNGRFWQMSHQYEQGKSTLFIASIAATGGFYERHPYEFKKHHSAETLSPIPGEEDGLWLTETVYTPSEAGYGTYDAMYIVRVNAEGKEVARTDVTRWMPDESTLSYGYMNGAATADGKYCVYFDECICLFDGDGQLLFEIEVDPVSDDEPEFALTADGRIAVMMDVGFVPTLFLVDESAQTLQSLGGQNLAYDPMHLASGDEFHDLYIFHKEIYGLDIETGERTRILRLADVDIDFNDVVSILPDGVSETGAPKFGCYENYNWNITPSCLQQRVAGAKKEIIELAVISIDLDLQDAIIEFNRRNTEYRIDYTEYRTVDDPTGLTGMALAMTTGDMPDIVDLSGLPENSYIRNGALMDLTPLMEADENLAPANLLPQIRTALTHHDGGIYGLQPDFTMNTMYTRYSTAGETDNWTYADVNEIFDGGSFQTPVAKGNREGYVLTSLLQRMTQKCVDLETMTSTFDSDEFIAFLEFAKRFPDTTFDDETDAEEYLEDGSALMLQGSWTFLSRFMDLRQRFGEDLQVSGIPGVGTMAVLDHRLAITSGCDNVEAAWSFLRHYMLRVEGENSPFAIPVLTAEYEDYVETQRAYYVNNADTVIRNGQPLYQPTEEDYAAWEALVADADMMQRSDSSIYSIVNEEFKTYMDGSRSASDTAAVIQSRVAIVLAEQG